MLPSPLTQLLVTAAVLAAAVTGFGAADARADEMPPGATAADTPVIDPDGPPFANSGRPFTPLYRPPTRDIGEASWFVVTDAVDTLLTPFTWEDADWRRLGAGAAVVGGAMLLDVGNFRFWRANHHDDLDELALKLNVWGSGGRAMGGFAAVFLGAWALDQPQAMRVSGAAISSIWVCSVIGRWGKGLTHRERPSTQGNNPDPLLWHGLPKPEAGSSAFPSGHTLGVWSWAWVIWDMVGGVPGGLAVAMATGVTLQRLYVSAHWLSDVTASILIAKVVAERVIALATEKTLSLHVDAWDADTAAVGLTVRF